MAEPNAKRILVLEDVEAMRSLIANLLASKGYEVSSPVDPYVALSIARREKFDLMTVDLYMSLMDGVTFVRALHDMGIDAPIVIVTAYPSDPQVEQLKQLGVRHFVAKPFRLEALFASVRDALGEADPDQPLMASSS